MLSPDPRPCYFGATRRARGETDITTGFGPVVGGSNPSGRISTSKRLAPLILRPEGSSPADARENAFPHPLPVCYHGSRLIPRIRDERPWFSGRTRPCQGRDASSILAGRIRAATSTLPRSIGRQDSKRLRISDEIMCAVYKGYKGQPEPSSTWTSSDEAEISIFFKIFMPTCGQFCA